MRGSIYATMSHATRCRVHSNGEAEVRTALLYELDGVLRHNDPNSPWVSASPENTVDAKAVAYARL